MTTHEKLKTFTSDFSVDIYRTLRQTGHCYIHIYMSELIIKKKQQERNFCNFYYINFDKLQLINLLPVFSS